MGFGLHTGPAVMGDIGTELDLAFAIIGDTFNAGGRLAAPTRDLSRGIVASETLVNAVCDDMREEGDAVLNGFARGGRQELRGRSEKVSVRIRATRRPSRSISE